MAIRVNVKELRAKLKHYLECNEPIVVQNHRQVAAVILKAHLYTSSPDREVGLELKLMQEQLAAVKQKLLED